MKVLVVGAAGRTGRLVVERAHAAGHQVVALVHDSDDERKAEETGKIAFPPGVELIHGDVRNPSRLEHAMQGCQAVIDAMGGHTPWAETQLESDAAKVVIEVMHRVGAKRLIVVSVLGAHESSTQTTWAYEHLLMPTFLRGAVEDKNAMEDVVMRSDVEFVLVRPPVLEDAEPTGSVRVVEMGEIAHTITRPDLAGFLVEQLTTDAYLNSAVTVANR
jgi:putative NADH-flavin reductase